MDIDSFFESLDKDLAWRKKEISDLQLLCSRSESEVLIKSLLLMLYSHWEGFIKNSSKLYLGYISGMRMKVNDLTLNFKTITMKGFIKECYNSTDALTLENEMRFIEKYIANNNAIFQLSLDLARDRDKTLINTRDNLSPEVFGNICKVIGLQEKNCLVTRKRYFDEVFINRRNAISHGSKVLLDESNEFDLDLTSLISLKDIVLLVMSGFQDDLKEYALKKFYLAENDESKNNYDNISNNQLNNALAQLAN